MSADEHELSTWGAGRQASNAALSDGVVLKVAGAWSPAVLALLHHFERTGFGGAPRVVGEGYAADGRMTLTYVAGTSAHPSAWSDDACAEVGALLRRAHDASAQFELPPGATWADSWLRDMGDRDDRVIGHGDAAPWNVVGPDTFPSALIDWDMAGPIDRLTEVAYAVWLNAQLHDDDIAELHDLPPASARARQARDIAEGYELGRRQRALLVDRMVEVALGSVQADAVEYAVTPDSTDAVSPSGYPVLWSLAWRARSAGWMFRNRRLLSATLER